MTKFLIKKFIGEKIEPNNKYTRKKCGALSGVVGIICNLILFLSKLMVGILSSSIAAMADAFNNLSDAGSSIITFVCFKIASNPADEDHPFGHGRIEYISGLIVSVAIIITGFGFIKSSIEKIFSPEEVYFDNFSLFILIASILIKLWMGFFNKKISNLINSSAMKATANDSFTDSIATITVIMGMFITRFTNLYLDPYAGLIVSGFIIFTGIKTLKETLSPLLGQAPDPNLVKKIKEFLNSYPELLGMEDLMIHNYGPSWNIISFKTKIIVNESNNDIFLINEKFEMIEKKLSENFNCYAMIRFYPVLEEKKEE